MYFVDKAECYSGVEKKIEFQLALHTSESQILLALGKS